MDFLKKHRKLIIGIAMVIFGGYLVLSGVSSIFFAPRDSSVETGEIKTNQNGNETKELEDIEVVANKLDIPWEIAFLPDGDMLITERIGNLKRIGDNQKTYKISGVEHVGEGGLLGLALHPDFEENNYLYLYLTTKSGEGLINRVERYVYKDDQLSQKIEIISGIPGASFHDGGRIEFGPDDMLYITTGDAGNEQSAQDKNSLAGKILRLKDDGSVPEDNPFGNEVYSYGHRNPQGIAWDDQGRLWSSEHGPSGLESGFDELNLIEKGGNYGWPVIRGSETKSGMISPVAQSGSDDTWAPAGLAFIDGDLYFAGLRGQRLYKAEVVSSEEVNLKAYLPEEYGRLRAVVVGPKGYLYVSTSNTDGRGDAGENDDKIIRFNSGIFD